MRALGRIPWSCSFLSGIFRLGFSFLHLQIFFLFLGASRSGKNDKFRMKGRGAAAYVLSPEQQLKEKRPGLFRISSQRGSKLTKLNNTFLFNLRASARQNPLPNDWTLPAFCWEVIGDTNNLPIILDALRSFDDSLTFLLQLQNFGLPPSYLIRYPIPTEGQAPVPGHLSRCREEVVSKSRPLRA
ncbi:hypothetical protein D5086_023229 [Populus alba]|uniref:Uncharacterized protein n=1 Tax=Populus alba TaxID=43335 RepID=A0ACC4B965_POPAL